MPWSKAGLARGGASPCARVDRAQAPDQRIAGAHRTRGSGGACGCRGDASRARAHRRQGGDRVGAQRHAHAVRRRCRGGTRHFPAAATERGSSRLALSFLCRARSGACPRNFGGNAAPVARVGIVGAGTMGAAISVCFLNSGIPVMLIERDQAALDRGVERIRSVYQRLVQSGRMSAEEMERRLSMLAPTVALPALAQVDLVIEAVFEDMNVKQALMREPRPPVETRRRSRLRHFLSRSRCARLRHRPPGDCVRLTLRTANVMRLIEIVRGRATAPDVLATVLALAKTIRKLPVIARVGEGFIGNRIFSAYRMQCEALHARGWRLSRAGRCGACRLRAGDRTVRRQ